MTKTHGKIKPENILFLREAMGTANDDGEEYELSINALKGTPIVESKRTGKQWYIEWEELIRMAIAAGILKKTPALPRENNPVNPVNPVQPERTPK
jgi:hypothetical protein